ncbi:pirin family protein [Xanthovirga aplysinae]|uniref:pirin family protein n=1 Tax=Xanthovirga aplysinae TaxID=2529853 RepID=UPI0012BB94E1|nr:pirin family protein [Xanthovirga aplysinae]MTI30581.1 pirin family protein [Xanthovirga aplysinae]
MRKTIKQIITSQDVMMGKARIGQPLPSKQVETIDPFILLHHAGPKNYPAGNEIFDVAPHPHRGFEPITFIFKGEVEHKDSLGNHKVVGQRGVQWITAGRGIIHSEGAPKTFQEKGGDFELIQLWANLPKNLKMTPPNYQAFTGEEIPFIKENNYRVNVISGNYKNVKGPIKSLTEITALTIELDKNGKVFFDFPSDKNTLLYQLHGNTTINEKQIGNKQLVEFEGEGNEIEVKAQEKSLILLLAGKPNQEPISQYGPFVMNTQTEVLEAMRDYQNGKMGFL